MARPLILVALALLSLPASTVAASAQSSFGQSVQEQQIYDNSPTGRQQSGLLQTGNPIELMNKLRRSSAMDNATTPGDAVDQALRALDTQGSPVPQTPGSSAVKAP